MWCLCVFWYQGATTTTSGAIFFSRCQAKEKDKQTTLSYAR